MSAPPPVPPNTTLNHWLVPVFNGEPRLLKTPLAYWCVAALAKAGLTLDEFTVRLPSALSTVLLALVTLALGRRMLPPRAALIGALVLATMAGVSLWGRNARPDMLLTLWMTVAMACFYLGWESPGAVRRSAWLLAGWFAAGLGNLSKEFVPLLLALPLVAYAGWLGSTRGEAGVARPPCGTGGGGESPEQQYAKVTPPVAPSSSTGGGACATLRRLAVYLVASVAGLLIYGLIMAVGALHWWSALGLGDLVGKGATLAVCLGAPVLWYLLASRGLRELLPLVPTAVPGAAVMFAMFIPWFWSMAQLFPQGGSVVGTEVVERVGGVGRWSEVKLPGYYLAALAGLALPWTVFLPGGFAAPFMKRFERHRDALAFLLLWVVGLLLLSSASAGMRFHYILPCLPAVALLTGMFVDDLFFNRSRQESGSKAGKVAGACLAVTAALAAGAAGAFAWSGGAATHARIVQALVAAGVFVLPCAVAAGLAFSGRRRAAAVVFVAACALCLLAWFTRDDVSRNDLGHVELLRQERTIVPTGRDRVVSWRKIDPESVFYLDRVVPESGATLSAFVRTHGDDEGRRLFDAWLKDPGVRVWIVARLRDAEDLAKLGFVPAERDPAAPKTRDPLVLFRRAD